MAKHKPEIWTPEMGGKNTLVLVADVETTGLPITWAARYSEVDNWPHITQVGFGIWNTWGNEVLFESTLIKPDKWTVPTTPFFIENNMSTERCEREGKPIREVMDRFVNLARIADVLVFHNASYDWNVIRATLVRIGMPIPKVKEIYCTKLESTDVLKLPGHRPGTYKWPSLEELSQFLLGKSVEGAHDAGVDVRATAECYFALKAYKEMQDLF